MFCPMLTHPKPHPDSRKSSTRLHSNNLGSFIPRPGSNKMLTYLKFKNNLLYVCCEHISFLCLLKRFTWCCNLVYLKQINNISGLQSFPRDSHDRAPGSHVGWQTNILSLMAIGSVSHDVICTRSKEHTECKIRAVLSVLQSRDKVRFHPHPVRIVTTKYSSL